MNTPPELLPFIESSASRYGIDPSWIAAIITQESQWKIQALRYESSYPYVYEVVNFAKLVKVSLATELCTQKISWGLGQVMGALAREQGFKGPMPDLLHPDVNIDQMGIRLKYLKKVSDKSTDVFSMYNAGPLVLKQIVNGVYPNQLYVNNVTSYLKK
jgi:hypothetical protein